MVIESGKISVQDLQFDCIIGTLPYERENVQPIVLNLSIWLDFTLAARNEDLAHSIDYVQLSDSVREFICNSQFQLVETLVIESAKFILSHYPKVEAAEVMVRKPLAIPSSNGSVASVKISR